MRGCFAENDVACISISRQSRVIESKDWKFISYRVQFIITYISTSHCTTRATATMLLMTPKMSMPHWFVLSHESSIWTRWRPKEPSVWPLDINLDIVGHSRLASHNQRGLVNNLQSVLSKWTERVSIARGPFFLWCRCWVWIFVQWEPVDSLGFEMGRSGRADESLVNVAHDVMW